MRGDLIVLLKLFIAFICWVLPGDDSFTRAVCKRANEDLIGFVRRRTERILLNWRRKKSDKQGKLDEQIKKKFFFLQVLERCVKVKLGIIFKN